MTSNPAPDTLLHPLTGPAQPLAQYLTTFHLVLVVLDPFTLESAWLLETGARVLDTFMQADCHAGWLVAGDPDECRSFLGPYAAQFLTFSDPDRAMIRAMGLERLPALVDLGLDGSLLASAQGWDPQAWQVATDRVASMLSWKGPQLPTAKDPAPFEGSPALG